MNSNVTPAENAWDQLNLMLPTLLSASQPLTCACNGESSQVSASELMHGISIGEHEAFELLLTEHAAALFSFIQRRVRTRETAEDLFQEVWMRVINHAKSYRATAPLRPWLYRIALNAITDHARRELAIRRGGNVTHALLDENTDISAPADTSLLDAERNSLLNQAIEQLPEAFREVVRLRYFEELSTTDVANVINCAEGTVKSRLSRALTLLQQLLGEDAR